MGMKRDDKRRWREAVTLSDLGELMAQWLEGRIGSWPGYQPNCGPDPETRHLIRPLATLNRAGFVTTGSQPGETGPGFDGLLWQQKAAVEGFVGDQRLLARLQSAARSVGAEVSTRDSIIVTTRGGRPYTGFGGRMTRGHMNSLWTGVSKAAWAELSNATFLVIAAREVGPAGESLWPALARATR